MSGNLRCRSKPCATQLLDQASLLWPKKRAAVKRDVPQTSESGLWPASRGSGKNASGRLNQRLEDAAVVEYAIFSLGEAIDHALQV